MSAPLFGVSGVNFFCALPAEGRFFGKAKELLGSDRVVSIPHRAFSARAMVGVILFCRRHRIDLIHSHGKGAGLYSRLIRLFGGPPVIHTLHGYHDKEYKPLIRFLYAFYEKLFLYLTAKVIAVSSGEASYFLGKTGYSEKVVQIVNGASLKRNAVSEESPSSVRVVTVARLTYQKNVDQVLDIAKLLPACHFEIIGDGEDLERLKRRIGDESIGNVRFLGEVDDVSRVLTGASLFLLCSRWEGLPLAPLEAMSLGVPLLLSNVIGNQEVIAPGVNGYLYEPENLGDAINKFELALSLDRSDVKNHHSQNFSEDVMVMRTCELYFLTLNN